MRFVLDRFVGGCKKLKLVSLSTAFSCGLPESPGVAQASKNCGKRNHEQANDAQAENDSEQ